MKTKKIQTNLFGGKLEPNKWHVLCLVPIEIINLSPKTWWSLLDNVQIANCLAKWEKVNHNLKTQVH